MIQLPPSPELTPVVARVGSSFPVPLSLHKTENNNNNNNWSGPRLRSLAKYKRFLPQAIACYTPMSAFLSEQGEIEAHKPLNHQSSQKLKDTQRYMDSSSSLGAVAGCNGVALFRMSRPQVPLLILSHASSTNTEMGSIRTLAFDPKSQNALLLAAARRTGVLIWDASGHSLSPLLGRLGADTIAGDSSDSAINSLTWIETASNPLLAVANSATVSVWDLRYCLSTSRPALRLQNSHTVSSPLLQIASAKNEEFATLDASGIVRVYDLRIAGPRGKGTTRTLCTFPAHQYEGAGLSTMTNKTNETFWITWGLDAPHAAAKVKVWNMTGVVTDIDPDHDIHTPDHDYWYMDGGSERSPLEFSQARSPKLLNGNVHLVAQFTTPGLSCARVCPVIFDDLKDHIITVSTVLKGECPGYRADVWKLNTIDKGSSHVGRNYGVEKVLSCGSDTVESQLTTTLGSMQTGTLIGAELAVALPQVRHDVEGVEEQQRDLLLCCLTDSGFVTTTTLFSSRVKVNYNKSAGRLTSWRKLGSSVTEYPHDPKGSILLDAAISIRHLGDSSRPGTKCRIDDSIHDGHHYPQFPTKTNDRDTDIDVLEPQRSARASDIGGMQFDLDDVALNQGVIVGAGSNSGVSTVDDNQSVETSEGEAQRRKTILNAINTRDVPCPRLCGAIFSPGMGGLICFQNGEVEKMWAWFKQLDAYPLEIKGIPFLKSKDPDPFHESKDDINEKVPQKAPRTLKDLIDMKEASEDAQWGLEEDSAVTDAEGSDGSLDEIFSDGESDYDGDTDSDDSEDMYYKYFGKPKSLTAVHSSISVTRTGTPSQVAENKEKMKIATKKRVTTRDRLNNRPTTDLLAPIVSVRHAYDSHFNGQSPELAERFLLGDWCTPTWQKTCESDSSGRDDLNFDSSEKQSRIRHFRPIMPRKQKSSVSSDSETLIPTRSLVNTRMHPQLIHYHVTHNGATDEAVHGGEYSVRPSRQESVIFLKKLFSHQQDGPSYQNLVSPPDAPMLPKNRKQNNPVTTSRARITPNSLIETSVVDATKVGVVLLSPEKQTNERQSYLKDMLRKTKLICIHNSSVCRDLGQNEKADVWFLLAETILNQINDESETFSGWGGSSGGALGRDMIINFLNYYESVGDIQMLSTMVCVLSGGQRTPVEDLRESYLLLPAYHDKKYDLFMRRYSDLLYSWGLLTVRAEVIKHIVYQIPTTDTFEIAPTLFNKDGLRTPGLRLDIWCSKCDNGKAIPGTNKCSSCLDFAFRCSICDNAVRGLFTVCEKCGHGGHVNHMTRWFSCHSMCPTGCGCSCANGLPRSNPVNNIKEQDSELPIVDSPIGGFHNNLLKRNLIT